MPIQKHLFASKPQAIKTLLAFILIFLITHFFQVEDWSQWLGPQHNGRSNETLPQSKQAKDSIPVIW